jgi:soluble lytic murein transglycosylase-like protein
VLGTALAAFANQLDHITMMSESRGDPNAVSPAGARGLMQVMPETARHPGFGIRPSNGSAADDVRVGKEYRAAMQSKYGGDLSKMWAAYNWGPNALDTALERHGDNWLQHAPTETRKYIAQNMRALGR